MFQLMINVQNVLHENEIDYFITKGTLIGSLRHHDVIPWDTDIDIFIPSLSVSKFKNNFQQLNIFNDRNSTKAIPRMTTTPEDAKDSGLIQRKDLVVYEFRNVHKVTSYKIFSIHSSPINRAHYRWPKIDIFPYRESSTHLFAHPNHRHNLGTMSFLAKTAVYPTHLRPLGPLLVPTPQHLQQSLRAMIRLGQSNVFYVCEGNTFLHRQNRVSTETWRVPCRELAQSYPLVKSQHDSSNKICLEKLILTDSHNNQQKSISSHIYKCNEHLPRTL